jgi:hydrogenase expression/formation protein HypD
VCVTATEYVDKAVAVCRMENVILATFGDMFKVPGSTSSLAREKARGGDVRIVYSPLDALTLARENRNKSIVFLGIGFETTAPGIAATIQEAGSSGIANFLVLSAFKTIPAALRALLTSGELKLDGLVLPGHLSTVTGTRLYDFMAEEFKVPGVVTGFEPLDILQGILMLVRQVKEGRTDIEIAYSRTVRRDGNPKAMEIMWEVFEESDSTWRGIGLIPGSGLRIREEYASHDCERVLSVAVPPARDNPGCRCGEVLRGIVTPSECRLFGSVCTPADPQGACMVSSEGTCAAYYRYGEVTTDDA